MRNFVVLLTVLLLAPPAHAAVIDVLTFPAGDGHHFDNGVYTFDVLHPDLGHHWSSTTANDVIPALFGLFLRSSDSSGVDVRRLDGAPFSLLEVDAFLGVRLTSSSGTRFLTDVPIDHQGAHFARVVIAGFTDITFFHFDVANRSDIPAGFRSITLAFEPLAVPLPPTALLLVVGLVVTAARTARGSRPSLSSPPRTSARGPCARRSPL